jgi:hypothetical protein
MFLKGLTRERHGLNVAPDDLLDGIDGLAGWAAVHLAVARERREAA